MFKVQALVGDLHVRVLSVLSLSGVQVSICDGRIGDRVMSTRWVLSHRD
jgi:hypothetical protein